MAKKPHEWPNLYPILHFTMKLMKLKLLQHISAHMLAIIVKDGYQASSQIKKLIKTRLHYINIYQFFDIKILNVIHF